jgi:hypothetical protein
MFAGFAGTALGATYGGGSGTAGDPFLIYTAEQMNAIGPNSFDWDKHFKLMADIDLGAYTGTSFNIIGSFTGVFDGNDHTISNFTYGSDNFVGIFGEFNGGEIRDVGLIDPNIDVGGIVHGVLVGRMQGGSLLRCYVDGGWVRGNRYVGGLVGDIYPEGTISECYSTASVSGNDAVGGLIGDTTGGVISDCYSWGSVAGTSRVGGLIGDANATISNCYSTGGVSGTDAVGGLLGGGKARTVTASFWDTQTSGQSSSTGGEGKTTAEMQDQSTFLSAGWDFSNVWEMPSDGGYPELQDMGSSQPPPPPPPGSNEGLLAYYPFNGNANDETGNGHDGIVYGATLTADRFGNADSAYEFDGVGDYIEATNPEAFGFINQSFSVSVWAKVIQNRPVYESFVGLGSTNRQYCVNKWRFQDAFYTEFDHGPSQVSFYPAGGLQADTWYHLVSVVNTESGYMEFYGDGILRGSNGLIDFDFSSGTVLRFGTRPGIGNYLLGAVDDVRIYNRALSAAEVAELYTLEPGTGPYCTAYPTMDFNRDCRVDFEDLCIFLQSWMECNLVPPETCWE